MILSLAHRLRKPPLVVDSPYASSVYYRFPPSMFVGVGGKHPGMGAYIGSRPPIYKAVIGVLLWIGKFIYMKTKI